MASTTNSKPEAVADLAANENDPHPSRKVFDVAELLERVLLHVPIQDLIAHAPLVCKEWKQMIDTSPILQKGLFLRSIAEPADGKKAVRVANPMIYQNTSKKGLAIKGDRWGPDPRYANRSWKSMFMCQPPLHDVYMTWIRRPSAPVIRSGLALRSLPGRPDHVIDPTGIKLGTYGASTTGQLARQRRFFGSDSDYLSSDVKSWKRAETPADVLQLLGVGGD